MDQEHNEKTRKWDRLGEAVHKGMFEADDGLFHVRRHLSGKEFLLLLNNIDPDVEPQVQASSLLQRTSLSWSSFLAGSGRMARLSSTVCTAED
jgi:hypothetical protein